MKFKNFLRNFSVTLVMSIIYTIIGKNYVFAKIPTNFEIDWSQANQFTGIGNGILGTLQVVGTFATVGALMWIGIKYMLGSVEEKSKEKEALIYYVIGAILVLAIVNILPLIYNFATDLFKP